MKNLIMKFYLFSQLSKFIKNKLWIKLHPIKAYLQYRKKKYVKLLILILIVFLSLRYIYLISSLAISIPKVDETISLTILVKTSIENHRTRIPQIMDTWFNLYPNDIYFITDISDPITKTLTKDKLISSTCASNDKAYCEFAENHAFLISKNTKWSCLFEDDNYVNVPQLIKVLSTLNHTLPHYLGRSVKTKPNTLNDKSFYYAKRSGGICLSQEAMNQIKNKIIENKENIEHINYHKLDRDMVIGYIMSALLEINLTEMPNFYSSSENMPSIPIHELHNMPVLSQKEETKNYVILPHFFDPQNDPYKFLTLHCFLYPDGCPTRFTRLPINVFDENKVR